MPARIVILAGFRRSLPPLILLDALAGRDDVTVVAVVCVNEYSLRRIRAWRRRFGRQFAGKVRSVLRGGGGTTFDEEREVLASRVRASHGALRALPVRCRELGVAFEMVTDLNAPDGLARLRAHRPDYAIYAGGGILRRSLLESVPGGVLNVHSGPLPHVRGMSGPEWSLYLGLRPTATVHFIDPGIDTGAILGEVCLDVEPREPLGRIRGRTLLAGVELLASLIPQLVRGAGERRENPTDRGRQYHEMAPALKRVVQSWVDRGVTPVANPSEVDPDDLTPANRRRGRDASVG